MYRNHSIAVDKVLYAWIRVQAAAAGVKMTEYLRRVTGLPEDYVPPAELPRLNGRGRPYKLRLDEDEPEPVSENGDTETLELVEFPKGKAPKRLSITQNPMRMHIRGVMLQIIMEGGGSELKTVVGEKLTQRLKGQIPDKWFENRRVGGQNKLANMASWIFTVMQREGDGIILAPGLWGLTEKGKAAAAKVVNVRRSFELDGTAKAGHV
jgi:hypothetical protein